MRYYPVLDLTPTSEEWPLKERAKDFMNDSEYAPPLRAHTEGSVSHHYIIKANDNLA